MKKRLWALCFAIVMICGMGGNVVATTYTNEKDIPLSTYRDDDLDIDPVDTGATTWSTLKNTLESEYISPYVTSVKNQSPYGTCWAFSFIGAAEASLIREGLASLEGEQPIDLSELQLAYYLTHSVTDPLGGTAGDRFSLTDTSINSFLKEGGNQKYATYRVASWYGLVNETEAPYDSISGDEEMTLSDELAYASDVFHLENAYWISMEDHNTVKKMIQQYGACAASYYTADTYYNTGDEFAENQTEEVAVYCPESLESNHGIVIVGWDDNYSADNFGTYKPDSDGAWYCRNSWGSEWSKDGYFWISYEDVPLSEGEAFFYDFGKADNYDKNYQYDGGALDASYPCGYSANIYTAQEDEYIKAVGFYTKNSNYNCTVKVYKNCVADNPTSGTLIATVDADQLYAGFHTVELGDTEWIKQGERFSVVVYQSAADGNSVKVWVDATYYPEGKWCANVSSATEGQSFISSNGNSWQDISVDGNNCRIKAYTDVRNPVTSVTLDQSAISLYAEETAKLVADVYPADASNTRVTWTSSDDTVATVDEDGNITAKIAGKVTVTCMSVDDPSVQAQCTVTVKQRVESIRLDWSSRQMMKGDQYQLKAIITPADASNQSLEWYSSDTSVVVVSDTGELTAIGYGTATITCVATAQDIQSTACNVTVYETMNSISLQVTETTLEEGETLQLQATTNPAVDRTMGVYWISVEPDMVSVSNNGLITAKAVCENVEVRCIAKDGTGTKATCLVTVANPPVVTQPVIREQGDVISDSASNATYKVIIGGTTGATVELSAGKNSSGEVTIPDTITADGITYEVTGIAPGAFKGNKQVTKVIMRDNITTIGKNAFSGCSKLTDVTIGRNVKVIEDKAFYQCKKLKKIVIPENVNRIGKKAFGQCKSLKSIKIKTTKLTKMKIGSKAFQGIHSKATIKVPKKKWKAYKSILKARGVGKKAKFKKI